MAFTAPEKNILGDFNFDPGFIPAPIPGLHGADLIEQPTYFAAAVQYNQAFRGLHASLILNYP